MALRVLRGLYPDGLFVIDGPSLLRGAGAALLGASTDAVLLVVAGSTPEPDLVRASRGLGAGQRVGIVYNTCPG